MSTSTVCYGQIPRRCWRIATLLFMLLPVVALVLGVYLRAPGDGVTWPHSESGPRLRFVRSGTTGPPIKLAHKGDPDRPGDHHAFVLTQVSNPAVMVAFEHRVELSVHRPRPRPTGVTVSVPTVQPGFHSVNLPLEPARGLTDQWYSPPVIFAVPAVAAQLARQSGRQLYTSWGAILIRCPTGNRWHEPPGMIHALAHVSGRQVETRAHLLNPRIELVLPSASTPVVQGARESGRAITLRLRFPFTGQERLVVDDGMASSQDAIDLTGLARPRIGDSRLLTIEGLESGPLRLCIANRQIGAGRHEIVTTQGHELGCSGVEIALDVP